MGRTLSDYRIFWRQFRDSYRTTGAVMPSGKALASALSRHVGSTSTACKVLEVGPGTGAVTQSIVRRLGSHDQFDLVELNDQFVARLHERFETEPAFVAVAGQSRVLHKPVETLPERGCYDLIISGLPLNNFSVELVEQLLKTLMDLLKPGGTLSFFQYIAIRKAKAMFSSGDDRERLREIGRLMDELLNSHEFARDHVWPNIPPAYVHHVRRPAEAVNSGPVA